MSAMDWESRELHEASRERLLTEIGMLHQTYDVSKVTELERQVLELKRELLSARDFAKGAAAVAGEQQAQLAAAKGRITFLSKHINQMRNSTTWKLGRIAMLPVRVAKRVMRRPS